MTILEQIKHNHQVGTPEQCSKWYRHDIWLLLRVVEEAKIAINSGLGTVGLEDVLAELDKEGG